MTSADPKVTILVVDDYAMGREVTAAILRHAGFEVAEAATGEEALRVARRRPDLIVLDVRLPDMDGLEVCRRIKMSGETASVPILHLSGTYRAVEDRIRGLEAGADGYLTKPVTSAELIATVRALLRARNGETDPETSEARRRAAEALVDVGRLVGQSLSPEEVGQRIAQSVRGLLAVRASAVYRLEPSSGDLVAVAASGHGATAVLPPGTGVAGLAVRERRPVVTPDLVGDPRVTLAPETRVRAEQAGNRAALAVPLLVQDRVIGALAVSDRAGRVFAEAEIRLAQAFAAQAAVALDNTRLHVESARRQQEAEELAQVARNLTESLDLGAVGQQIVDGALPLFRVESATIRLRRPDGSLVGVASAGRARDHLPPGHVIPSGMGLVGRAAVEGRPIRSRDVMSDPGVSLTDEMRHGSLVPGIRAVLAVPLRAKGEVIGVLSIGSEAPRGFADSEVDVVQAFADQVTLALENARLYAETRERLKETETLLAVGQVLALDLPTEEAMRRVAREVGRAFQVDTVGAYFLDSCKEALVPLAGYHIPKHLLPTFLETPFPISRFGFTQEACQARTPVWSADAMSDARFDHAVLAAVRPRAVLFAPTLVREEIVGGLFLVCWTPGRTFAAAELRLIEGVATQVGLALERADLARATKARQAMQFAVTRVLAESTTLAEAIPTSLQAICEGSGWDLGEVWHLDRGTNRLRWGGGWHASTLEVAAFEAVSRETTFAFGDGLPGRVWASGQPVWLPDAVAEDPRFTRGPIAGQTGVHAAFAFPIRGAGDVTGVMVLFSRDVREPDDALRRIVADLGAQIGQFAERKRAEAALREREEQLRQTQKMEAIGRLAGGIAHDFNNLLTVILGRAELLRHRLGADDVLRHDLDLIKQTGNRAAALTQQLLAFSRKQLLQPRTLDLGVLVTGLERMLRRLIGEDVDLMTVSDAALGRVRADPGQLEQVILNLVVNARDAMPQGGRLTLKTANVDVNEADASRPPAAPPGPYVMLVVTDTGVGMDAETQAHLFEPFFTTKAPGRGTGLGLATVYGIVKQSGGYISVDTAPWRGTSFRILLPRVESPVHAVDWPAEPAESPRGSETVLLVEDEALVRDLAREILKDRGYHVLEARHGAEALLVAKRHPGQIHLLLTDVVMPRMSGRELAERLTLVRPKLTVLYISGYTDDALSVHGLLNPTTALVEKPFTPDALAHKVREVLDASGEGHG